MAAPIYLSPIYVNYSMIENQLSKSGVLVTTDPAPGAAGMYIDVVNDYMNKGEAYVLQTILARFVNIPLQTIYYTGDPDGSDFDTLYDNPKYSQTYSEIRDLILNSCYWQIFKAYFGESGSVNGADIVRQYANKVNSYTNVIQRLDQASNALVPFAFAGLKKATNSSQRIAKMSRSVCGIPQGEDNAWSAFTANPKVRWGFNR